MGRLKFGSLLFRGLEEFRETLLLLLFSFSFLLSHRRPLLLILNTTAVKVTAVEGQNVASRLRFLAHTSGSSSFHAALLSL